MAVDLRAPENSFVQFSMSDETQSCDFGGIELCLPVLEDNDVTFQFILTTDTEGEANALCDLGNSKVRIGIVEEIGGDYVQEFTEKSERYRVGEKQILHNWSHGLPGFSFAISRGQCFWVKIIVDNLYTFHSTCFQRIAESCHTSIIEYSNEDNYAGFNYCNSAVDEIDGKEGCFPPTIITFTNKATLVIPYTADLHDKYGNVPSVKAWIYNQQSELVEAGIYIALNNYPVTDIRFDFGGPASGIIVIR